MFPSRKLTYPDTVGTRGPLPGPYLPASNEKIKMFLASKSLQQEIGNLPTSSRTKATS